MSSKLRIGVIGAGRIGSGVLKRIKCFGTSKILINDLSPNRELDSELTLEWTSKEKIYQEAS